MTALPTIDYGDRPEREVGGDGLRDAMNEGSLTL